MSDVTIPDVRVGEPVRCGALAVVPLYHEPFLFPDRTLDYLLSDEAQEAGMCAVWEVSPEGKVGEVLVENSGDQPVFFVEGEELVGAKQNRIMRASVFVAAGSRVVVPVYCTERGRWDGTAASLRTGSHAPPSLRRLLKGGSGTGFSRWGDGQAAVWRLIAARHRAAGTPSPKGNMSDALKSHPEVLTQLRQDLQYAEGASGIAVVMRGRIVGIDVFDKPDSLQKLWDRLVIMGLTLDTVDLRDADRHGDDISRSVGLYMESVGNMRWQRVEPVIGMGETYRATGNDGSQATALVMDGVAVHLSVSIPMGG